MGRILFGIRDEFRPKKLARSSIVAIQPALLSSIGRTSEKDPSLGDNRAAIAFVRQCDFPFDILFGALTSAGRPFQARSRPHSGRGMRANRQQRHGRLRTAINNVGRMTSRAIDVNPFIRVQSVARVVVKDSETKPLPPPSARTAPCRCRSRAAIIAYLFASSRIPVWAEFPPQVDQPVSFLSTMSMQTTCPTCVPTKIRMSLVIPVRPFARLGVNCARGGNRAPRNSSVLGKDPWTLTPASRRDTDSSLPLPSKCYSNPRHQSQGWVRCRGS